MNSMLNSLRYKLMSSLQNLQEISKKDYAEAKARLNNQETFKFNGEEFDVNLETTEEAQERVAKFENTPDDITEVKRKKNKLLDEFVELLDERKKRKKRKKRKSKKPKPNAYQRKKYKARAGTRRGDTMARLSNKIRKGKKLTKADYKARDDSEAAERKKKGYKSKPRFDTGMYISEEKKRELDAFVELLDEKKKTQEKKIYKKKVF